MTVQPGIIALLGSGETAANGGRAFETIARRYASPLRVAVLETPAGFELNSERVAGRVAEFIERRLQNHAPQVSLIPARRRGDACGPDNPEILAPLATADIIFMGPGSPTYAVRSLRDTLAWQAVLARHAEGAAIVLASAAAIAAGYVALPVYEIYKAGEDLHWQNGLDLLGHHGAHLAIVPHWNNAEGGSELDTSHCFMGQSRFDALAAMLPAETGIAGIDEHTTLLIDPHREECRVLGRGQVTIISEGIERSHATGSAFPVAALGRWRAPEFPPMPAALRAPADESLRVKTGPPREARLLAEQREEARQRKDWARADTLRAEIEAQGWEVRDTPDGPELIRL